MKIRLYKKSDLKSLVQIFYDSVHQVCKKDYTDEQLEAWAPKDIDYYRWENSLERYHTIVVEKNDHLIGFATIGETGYIDYLFVNHHYLSQGVASLLLQHLEKYAKAKNMNYINVAASLTSKQFFESKGYILIKEDGVERRGVRMRRCLMEKKL